MEIELSDEIKCKFCESFLSVPPIIDVQDIGIVCGRCQDLIYVNKTNPKIDRQSLYERIAACRRFPCKYQSLGCVEKPTWNDVSDHEKSCSFSIMACSYRSTEDSDEQCEWSGNIEHFISHFKDVHAEYFFTQPKVSVNEILTKKYCMLLTEYSKIFILFRFLFDEKTDSIYVMAATNRNEKAKGIHYELKMSDENKSLSFFEYSVLNCLYIGANVKQFGTKIKISLIRPFPEFDYIAINIKFDIKFPCINSSEGCNFIQSYSGAVPHRNICPFNVIKCVSCDWNGRRDTFDTHVEKIHEISDFHKSYSLINTFKVLFFKLDGQFLSCSVKRRSIIYWDLIVHREQIAYYGYKYEIEIFCKNLSSTKLLFQHKSENKLFEINGNIKEDLKITLPQNLLEQLFPDISDLHFKFNVSKLGTDK